MLSDTAILSAAFGIGSIVVAWGMDKADKSMLQKQVGLLFKWKDEHEKQSSNVRLEFSKEISQIAATLQVNQSQYAEILRRLDALDNKIDRIETRDEV